MSVCDHFDELRSLGELAKRLSKTLWSICNPAHSEWETTNYERVNAEIYLLKNIWGIINVSCYYEHTFTTTVKSNSFLYKHESAIVRTIKSNCYLTPTESSGTLHHHINNLAGGIVWTKMSLNGSCELSHAKNKKAVSLTAAINK